MTAPIASDAVMFLGVAHPSPIVVSAHRVLVGIDYGNGHEPRLADVR